MGTGAETEAELSAMLEAAARAEEKAAAEALAQAEAIATAAAQEAAAVAAVAAARPSNRGGSRVRGQGGKQGGVSEKAETSWETAWMQLDSQNVSAEGGSTGSGSQALAVAGNTVEESTTAVDDDYNNGQALPSEDAFIPCINLVVAYFTKAHWRELASNFSFDEIDIDGEKI